MRRSALFRALTVLFSLLLNLASPLAAAADARAISETVKEGHALVHVEDHGSSRCRRVHPDSCALCHVAAGLLATLPHPPQVAPAHSAAVVAPPSSRLGAGTATRCALARPRAPPVV